MNREADDVFRIEGTDTEGRQFILVVNLPYDVPINMSGQGIVEEAAHESRLAAVLANTGLLGVGIIEIWRGEKNNSLADAGLGQQLVISGVGAIPATVGRRSRGDKIRLRLSLVASAILGGLGAWRIRRAKAEEVDDAAQGWRALSGGINGGISSAILYFVGP